jgi:hypothetical protein
MTYNNPLQHLTKIAVEFYTDCIKPPINIVDYKLSERCVHEIDLL